MILTADQDVAPVHPTIDDKIGDCGVTQPHHVSQFLILQPSYYFIFSTDSLLPKFIMQLNFKDKVIVFTGTVTPLLISSPYSRNIINSSPQEV
jgi:hypothetical protein